MPKVFVGKFQLLWKKERTGSLIYQKLKSPRRSKLQEKVVKWESTNTRRAICVRIKTVLVQAHNVKKIILGIIQQSKN